MNKLITLVAALLTFSASAKMKEADYVDKYCEGTIEYRLADKTRIDCLTASHAIEYDYGRKWAEAIGQSLFYAAMTGKKAGIVLIVNPRTKDRYLKRLHRAIAFHGLEIDVKTVAIELYRPAVRLLSLCLIDRAQWLGSLVKNLRSTSSTISANHETLEPAA